MYNGRTTVTGGNHVQVSASTAKVTQNINITGVESEAFKTLVANVAPRALHDSGEISDPPKCHPGTRVDVINVFITWAMSTIYMFPIKWLNGRAGAGKSAIMRTLAEKLVEKRLLLASFFFFRSDANRNTVERLVSTIAFQICLKIPPLRPHIERAIELNPLIFKASLSAQIQTLVIHPFLQYFDDPNSIAITPFPRIVIIDGLDECEGHETQREILNTLCRMLQMLPTPLAIVVASRPEHQICIAFELGDLCEASSRVTLDDNFNPDKDIRAFYDVEFAEIRTTHPMRNKLGKAWPTSPIIDRLVLNASGQFIYPSTIVKFIKSSRHHPAVRLQIILGLADRGTSKPFQQLDLLYSVIFQNLDSEALPDAVRVLGIILASPLHDNLGLGTEFQSPRFLDTLLGFSSGHVQSVLLDLESLLTVTDDRKDIRIFHTSLSDFLFDKSRAADFFINRAVVYADIASRCIAFFEGHQGWDPLLERYAKEQFEGSLRNASPTEQLRRDIVGFDLRVPGQASFVPVYGVWVPAFLTALRQSNFPDAEKLYQIKMASFSQIVNSILTDHWFQCDGGSYTFQTALLMVVVLALGNVDDVKASRFVKSVSPLHRVNSISIFPMIKHFLDEPESVAGPVDYSCHTLPRSLLDAIDSPGGLLHLPNGQAGCTHLTIHLLRRMSEKKYVLNLRKPETSEKDCMEYALPFLLNISLVQDHLTVEAKRVRSDRSSDGAYLRSETIASAIDQYLERARNWNKERAERPPRKSSQWKSNIISLWPGRKR